MTRGFAAAIANKMLDAIRDGGATMTVVADTYVKLHIGDPGSAGTANPSAGTTTRVLVAQAAPSGGGMVITGTNPQFTNGGATEDITDISVWDHPTAGTFQYSVQLASPKSWLNGQTFTLTALSVSIAPIAA
jgi:hypothetical protein